VVDTETTGLDPRADAVVEVAWAILRGDGTILSDGATLINPGRPIPAEATRVHGIHDRDVASAPSLGDAIERYAGLCSPILTAVIHNAAFDTAFLNRVPQFRSGNPQVLCSMQLAMNLLPDVGGYSLDHLRGRLGLDNRPGASAAHRAAGDVATTTALLKLLVDAYLAAGYSDDLATFAQFSEILRMPFGKHQGTLLTGVPADYIDWLLGRDIDAGLRAALEKARRGTLRVPPW
jgi:DNA polymerase III epsilon subunit-like protein